MLKLYARSANGLHRLVQNDRGATAVEYGLLVALIAAVVSVVITTFGTKLSSTFNHVTTTI